MDSKRWGAGVAALMMAFGVTGAGGQAMVVEAETFDPNRALLSDEPMFDAFYPETTTLLSDALRSRDVQGDAAVLVVDVGDRKLALVTRQMAYHHVAQGELAGEPWMVTF